MRLNPTYFMSSIYKNKKQNKKSKTNKRFGGTKPNQMYCDVFPREMKVKLTYNEMYSYTQGASLSGDLQFRLNSVYDPFYTSSGHQPQGFDQWNNFYNRYRVDQARVTVRPFGILKPCVMTILANNENTGITAQEVASEAPGAIVHVITPEAVHPVLSKTYNLADITGVTRSVYNSDDRYSSLMSGNPSEVLNLHVVTTEATSSAFVVNTDVQIEYWVTFFDPNQQLTS